MSPCKHSKLWGKGVSIQEAESPNSSYLYNGNKLALGTFSPLLQILRPVIFSTKITNRDGTGAAKAHFQQQWPLLSSALLLFAIRTFRSAPNPNKLTSNLKQQQNSLVSLQIVYIFCLLLKQHLIQLNFLKIFELRQRIHSLEPFSQIIKILKKPSTDWFLKQIWENFPELLASDHFGSQDNEKCSKTYGKN